MKSGVAPLDNGSEGPRGCMQSLGKSIGRKALCSLLCPLVGIGGKLVLQAGSYDGKFLVWGESRSLISESVEVVVFATEFACCIHEGLWHAFVVFRDDGWIWSCHGTTHSKNGRYMISRTFGTEMSADIEYDIDLKFGVYKRRSGFPD